MSVIERSEGINETENALALLCDNVFLKLWSYPNLYNGKGQELCDALIVFENQIFIFSVKDIKFDETKKRKLAWQRWKKKAINKSIEQVNGAERLIKKHPDKIFLDMNCTKPFPFKIDASSLKIYKIIVAHGVENACKNDSINNINGSLGISYIDEKFNDGKERPFMLTLNRNDIIHVLDSYNLDIILRELDTISDLSAYFEFKEELIKKTPLMYCGEEDLLASYIEKFTVKKPEVPDDCGVLFVREGGWQKIVNSEGYQKWKKLNEPSYFWDNLLQLASDYALNGTMKGSGQIFNGKSALFEMAKEPRNMRRVLSEQFLDRSNVIKNKQNKDALQIFSMPSCIKNVYYVVLQHDADIDDKKRNQYKMALAKLCESFVNKQPDAQKIIGIAINTFSSFHNILADFALLNCNELTDEIREHYKKFNFWDSKNIINLSSEINN